MPAVPTAPTRHTLPRRGSRSEPQLPPLNLPGGAVDFPTVHPAPARSSASAAGNRNWSDEADWEIPLFEERQRWEEQQEANQEPRTREPPPGFVGKIMVFLGYAGPNAQVQRALVSMVLGELWGLIQVRMVYLYLA